MTKAKKPSARELPLVKRRIAALLDKTEANGCTSGEAAAAFEKAEELSPSISSIRARSGGHRGPRRRSARRDQARARRSRHGTQVRAQEKGIGRLAELLIVEHPDWTYRRVAEEVNVRIDGAKASEKSVRWYASRMRGRGEDIANRRKHSD